MYTVENDNQISGNSGVFGLNHKAKLTAITLKEYGDKKALVTTFEVGDREYLNFIFEVKDGEDLYYSGKKINSSNENYEKALRMRQANISRNITHILKSVGFDVEDAKDYISKNPARNFADYIKKVMKFVPKDYKGKEVDLFLQYQKKVRKGQNATFLEVPNTLTYGKYVVPATEPVGSWQEVVDAKGLKYVDDEGNEHPFKRNKEFMDSNMAKRIVLNREEKEENAIDSLSSTFNETLDDEEDTGLPF